MSGCNTAKPRHPGEPCDEQARTVVILREHRGHALVRYPEERALYYGEYGSDDGVVYDMKRISRKEADRLFRILKNQGEN